MFSRLAAREPEDSSADNEHLDNYDNVEREHALLDACAAVITVQKKKK